MSSVDTGDDPLKAVWTVVRTMHDAFKGLWEHELKAATSSELPSAADELARLEKSFREASGAWLDVARAADTTDYEKAKTVVSAVQGLVDWFWDLLGRLTDFQGVQPRALNPSVSLKALNDLRVQACEIAPLAATALKQGGALLATALEFPTNRSYVCMDREARDTRMIPFVEWWVDEVLQRQWGVTDAWSDDVGELAPYSPLFVMSSSLSMHLGQNMFDFIASKVRLPAAYKSAERVPLCEAFHCDKTDKFDWLLEHGGDPCLPCNDGTIPAFRLFATHSGTFSREFLPPTKLGMLRSLLTKYPAAVNLVHTDAASGAQRDLLGAAIASGEVKVVMLALEHGARIRTNYSEAGGEQRLPATSDGSAERLVGPEPSLSTALKTGSYQMVALLIERGALDGWSDRDDVRYDAFGVAAIADALAKVAVSAFPRNDACRNAPPPALSYNPDRLSIVDLVLRKGFNWPWHRGSRHALLNALYPPGVKACALYEEDALVLLRRYHEAGTEVLRVDLGGPSDPPLNSVLTLAHLTAMHGQLDILDFAIKKCGCPPDACYQEASGRVVTPLFYAVLCKQSQAALHLLEKHTAPAITPGRPAFEQPLYQALEMCNLFDPVKLEALVSALLDRGGWSGFMPWDKGHTEPLTIAAPSATPDFLRFLFGKIPCSVDGVLEGGASVAPLCTAFYGGNVPAFEWLLEQGADPCQRYAGGETAALHMIQNVRFGFTAIPPYELAEGPMLQRRRSMLSTLLAKHPAVTSMVAVLSGGVGTDLLDAAVRSRDAALVRKALDCGAQLRFQDHIVTPSPEGVAGGTLRIYSTLNTALTHCRYDVVELLVREKGYLQQPRDHITLASEAVNLATMAVTSHVPIVATNPDGSTSIIPSPFKDEARRIVAFMLSSGFKVEHNSAGDNVLLSALYPAWGKPCPLSEDDALALLTLFRSHGLDVSQLYARGPRTSARAQLSVLAAARGQIRILDFAIDECGCLPDGGFEDENGRWNSPLTVALWQHQVATALHLLRNRRVQACYHHTEQISQPIGALLTPYGGNSPYTDQDAEMLLRALIERDSALLEVHAFASNRRGWSPVMACVLDNKPRTLKVLLTSRLPAVDGHLAVQRSGVSGSNIGPQPVLLSPAQVAAKLGNWDCLSLLLEHSQATVTDRVPPDHPVPSAAELVILATQGENPPSRALVASVLAKARSEKELAARTAATAPAAGSAPSNLCEDPHRGAAIDTTSCNATGVAADASTTAAAAPSEANSVGQVKSGHDSERRTEEETKGDSSSGGAEAAKKKRKKKSRKKRNSKNKNMDGEAAGAKGDSEDGADSSEDDEAVDDHPYLVDSRNAPSVDVMFAAMGLGPGGSKL